MAEPTCETCRFWTPGPDGVMGSCARMPGSHGRKSRCGEHGPKGEQ
jgi:hypothetical protein